MNVRQLQLLSERYLAEGGAYGHLMHLYDNTELTFGELKEVLSAAAEGHLEKATEKTDGMNLVFTWNVRTNELKVARSGGDIKRGGKGTEELAAQFKDRGNIADAFNGAFKVLRDAMSVIPAKTLAQIFGKNAERWYSIEVIYSANPNVINYDKNYIVFHAHGVFKLDQSGKVQQSADAPGVDTLAKSIDRMQNAVKQRGWHVAAPTFATLRKLSDGTVLSTALSEIEAAQNAGNVGDDGTIGDYLRNRVTEEVADLGLLPAAARIVVARVVGDAGAGGLPQIKKMVPADVYPNVKAFVDRSNDLLKHAIAPIEHAVHRFSIEVLRGMASSMVGSHDAEVKRLRAEVTKAANAISASGDVAAMDVLHKQMQKLGSVENISSSAEGIVFRYKGNVYKFTGAFAPANQILGLFKYGRKGTKLPTTESHELQNVIDDMIDGFLISM